MRLCTRENSQQIRHLVAGPERCVYTYSEDTQYIIPPHGDQTAWVIRMMWEVCYSRHNQRHILSFKVDRDFFLPALYLLPSTEIPYFYRAWKINNMVMRERFVHIFCYWSIEHSDWLIYRPPNSQPEPAIIGFIPRFSRLQTRRSIIELSCYPEASVLDTYILGYRDVYGAKTQLV